MKYFFTLINNYYYIYINNILIYKIYSRCIDIDFIKNLLNINNIYIKL